MNLVDQPDKAEPARAYASGPAARAVQDLVTDLTLGLRGQVATAVLYFASSTYDPHELAGPITRAFPDAAVIGCSTAGEFTDQVTGTGGISAVALPYGLLSGAVAALGELSGDVVAGTWSAVRTIEDTLQVPLRELDPSNHLGFVLIDGIHHAEEEVNEVLGNAAPLLDVVGGSAGDDLAFTGTWVSAGTQISFSGVALLVCRTEVPFEVVKTCSFVPTGQRLRITSADVGARTVLRFDDRPAAQAYADALGVGVDDLDSSVWRSHPLGLMINGQPWIRSPRRLGPQGAVCFYADILPGMEVELMEATDLIGDTRAALEEARARLSGHASGAVLFNCILRRLEIDAKDAGADFLATFGDLPVAGFHTYGESWIGHVNQTLTGVVFG